MITRRRLLKGLQQAVRGVHVQTIGAIDNDDAGATLMGATLAERHDLLCLFHQDLGSFGRERHDIRVQAACDASTTFADPTGRTGARRRRDLAVERHCQPNSGAPFPDASRPFE
jgi:hypothetical protein